MQRNLSRLAIALALTSALSFAQTKFTFEVATVKPAAPLDMAKIMAGIQNGQAPRIGPHVDAGRAEYRYLALRDLIAIAYGLKPYQVTGPDWMATTRFDIVAKMPEGAAQDDAHEMLQALLEERFKMTLHKSTAEHPVLALVVAKGGPKLKESTETPKPINESAALKPGEMRVDGPDGPLRISVGGNGSAMIDMGAKGKMSYRLNLATQSMHLDGSMVTMSGFADMLTQFSQIGGAGGRQIVDMTELKGNYQVAIDFAMADLLNMARASGMNIPPGAGGRGQGTAGAPSDAAPDPSGAASSITAAVQALGLKLESRKTMVEQLIVDHAEKTPTEN